MAGDRFVIEVQGVRELDRDLAAVSAQLEDPANAISKIAKEGERLVARAAPKRTGRLAASARGRTAGSEAVVTAGEGLAYGGVINDGWPRHNIAAVHYMEKAEAALEPRAVELLDQGITQVIRRRGLA